MGKLTVASITQKIQIRAPKERVFDLARSIDAHEASTEGTEERAIAGVTSGLIGLGDTVTWEARHFGVRQRLTVQITEFDRPDRFRDVMTSGAFQAMTHEHVFEGDDRATTMYDHFDFRAPLGVLGRIAEVIFLKRYMARFLKRRAEALKSLAESDGWRAFLHSEEAQPGATDNPTPHKEF